MRDTIRWLNNQIRERGLQNAHVHEPPVAREEGNWYFVPVYIDIRDAYDKAVLLQEIEDEWEKQQVAPGRNLLLMPAAN